MHYIPASADVPVGDPMAALKVLTKADWVTPQC